MSRFPSLVLSERHGFANLLRFCSKNGLLDQGIQVHGALVKMGFGSELVLNNFLLDMYAKCYKMDKACAVFDKMLERNVVSWTALMCGHILNGDAKESLSLFFQMILSAVIPNEFTFSTNLRACGLLGSLENGMRIHGMCVKRGFEKLLVVGNSITDMYSKCGRINEAEIMFKSMPIKNLISWNAMIAGYTLAGYGAKAISAFQRMQGDGMIPDEFTLTSMLKACAGLDTIHGGKQVHGFLITSGFPCLAKATTAGALIDLYVKSENLFEARKVFNHVEEKNVISWSSLILGYAKAENLNEALDLFRQLRISCSRIDGFVLSSIIGVFADYALVEQGRQMHAYTVKIPSGLETSVCNSIVDMYLKCGMIDEAERSFKKMTMRNLVSWTVMITGYANYGLGKEAIHLFDEMQLSGVEPDEVTYLAILSACSHCGLVKEGQEYLSRLYHDCRTEPRVEHYACIVDLLGRAGRLEEAKNVIETMPLKPNIGVWQTLLSACRLHGDIDLGHYVGKILTELDSENLVNYVTMSNIYAQAGYWKERERIRKMMKAKGLKKDAGRSWRIEQ